ncbi:cytosolic purine 5'-nucleotidase [Eurytemora carolleeae]|uniref:cytosolic purine 5'-nucleotidase n=1 Tax=Eurytemora carolleeae TaxID=1294199 RepID=UPI000C77FFB1|nr:cytosolic purine 5'-nucleotidase [Eurytemora carolleeae]|eukprot:XP_023338694.1 cytosolic purine 5'-nucleotidase-like [Eurytemora affinis]
MAFQDGGSIGYGSDDSLQDLADRSSPILKQSKIFDNRGIHLEKIQFYGFDMDYTLCEYISPEFDILAFNLAKEFLVSSFSYPQEILKLEYNPEFPCRGLWFDKEHGNLLKVDQFGRILMCCHGFRLLEGEELRKLYPHKIQRKEEKRIYIMNTLFNIAETHLLASIVHYMDNREDAMVTTEGWLLGSEKKLKTFKQMFEDVRGSIDYLHDEKLLKQKTVENLEKYIKKDERLIGVLTRIRESGRKTFLLTNSDWWYTNHIMTFLLQNNSNEKESWLDYFDLTIVDACKPTFFNKGTNFKMVDTCTGEKVDLNSKPVHERPVVYSGGDHHTVSNLLGADGPDVMYCGDHLHADVVKCRKLSEWRTLLIVPELEYEMSVGLEQGELMNQLQNLERICGQVEPEDQDGFRRRIKDGVKKMDRSFAKTGSIFRAGTRLSYFGSNVLAWADLYTGSVCNLYSYSLQHRFIGTQILLPHELQ